MNNSCKTYNFRMKIVSIQIVYLHLSIANNTCNVTMVISVVYLHLSIANKHVMSLWLFQ